MSIGNRINLDDRLAVDNLQSILVQTVRPLRFSQGIQSVCLPEAADGTDEGMSPCVSTGWGLMKDEAKDKDRSALQQVINRQCQ